MKKNRKGFTLAELLIVVAIIAVLVAIAIPVFTSQLEKSREATDMANVRSAYAEVVTSYLDSADIISIDVTAQQKVADWQTDPQPSMTYQGNGTQESFTFDASTTSYTVTIEINEETGEATPSVTAN